MAKTTTTGNAVKNEAALKDLSKLLRIASHRKVNEIIGVISGSTTGELKVGEIYHQTKQEQSLTSLFLKQMKDVDLVKGRRDGKNIYYSLNDETFNKLNKVIEMF